MPVGDALVTVAREVYRDFVGELWERYGADAWLASWSLAAARDSDRAASVIDLLESLEDPLTRSAADMLVNANPDPDAARNALIVAFDQERVGHMEIYSIGDGEAMSGVLIAAHIRDASEATFLVFLMD